MMRPALPLRLPAFAILMLGLAVETDRTEAQWINPYGGYYGGYGGTGMGMSLYEQNLYKAQAAALNASRFDLQNAQAVQSYEAANLLRQQADSAQLANAQRLAELQERYSASPKAKQYEAIARLQGYQQIPRAELLSESGKVLWPDVVLRSKLDQKGKREAAEKAIESAVLEAKQDGQASIRSVNMAREALIAYGRPTLSRLQTRGATDRLKGFLLNLDAVLEDLAKPTAPAGAGPEHGLGGARGA